MAAEGAVDVAAIMRLAMERAAAQRASIVRGMPKVAKRPSTRAAKEEEEEGVGRAERGKEGGRRQRGKGGDRVLKLSDRQRVAREVSAIMVSPDELTASQQLLQRMQQRQHFLRNPRSRGGGEGDDGGRVLEVDVEEVRWQRWDVGQPQRRTLHLTNVSACAQRLHITAPPTFPHPSPFTVHLSLPPSAVTTATLAPGMRAVINVTFTPTSLQSVTDRVLVSASSSPSPCSTLTIPLVAHRLPSYLTLPPVVRLPPALLSRSSTLRFRTHNRGLPSTFRLLTTHEHSQQLQQGVTPSPLSSTVRLGAFTVYPREFELAEDDDIHLTLTFTPTLHHPHSQADGLTPTTTTTTTPHSPPCSCTTSRCMCSPTTAPSPLCGYGVKRAS